MLNGRGRCARAGLRPKRLRLHTEATQESLKSSPEPVVCKSSRQGAGMRGRNDRDNMSASGSDEGSG